VRVGRQLSLFGVEAGSPVPEDLEGLLAGPGQVVRMGGTARVSVVVDELWRPLAAEHAPKGPTEEHLVEEVAGIIWRKRRLRLAEAARDEGVDLRRSALRVSIHAGEPGASIPTTRELIESELGVTSFDHTGATEIGAHGFSCSARDGVHINEAEFVLEVLDATGIAREEGEGELVLTNLGRWGMPVIRYRTGDRVRAVRGRCSCGRTLVKLAGGIAGRIDDMVTVRGVNVFPSAIEAIVRRFAEVGEYRVELARVREMDELRCIVEAPPDVAERVGGAIHRELGIRCLVEAVGSGTLPRFEMKAKRFRKTNV